MSVLTSVRLPTGLHQRVKDAAKVRGKSLNGLIVDTLAREFEELPTDADRGDIALAEFIGSVSSEGCDDGYDSRRIEEYFARGMERKHREGHL